MGQNLITGYQGAQRQVFTQQVYRKSPTPPPIDITITGGSPFIEMNYIAPGDTVAKTYFHWVNGNSQAVNAHMAYDPVLDVWTQKAYVPTTRVGIAFSGIQTKDKLYGFGGSGATANTVVSEVIEYVGSTNTWAVKTTTGAMTARENASAVLGGDGKIYVMGGDDNGATVVYKQTNECYDPVANSWTSKLNMTASARKFPTLVAFPTQNWVCLLGGAAASGYTQNNAYVFNTQTNTWATKAVPPFDKTYSQPILYNGLLYFLGGYSNPSGTSSIDTIVRTWNPVTDVWVAKVYLFDYYGGGDYNTDYNSPCFLYNGLIYIFASTTSTYCKTYKPDDDITTGANSSMANNALVTLVSQYPNAAVVQLLSSLRTSGRIIDAIGTTVMDGNSNSSVYGSNKFAGGTSQYAYMAMPPFDVKCDQSPWSYNSLYQANLLLY